jgi:hypothetical protein
MIPQGTYILVLKTGSSEPTSILFHGKKNQKKKKKQTKNKTCTTAFIITRTICQNLQLYSET